MEKKDNQEQNEVLSYDKCPNCGENTFIVEKRICINPNCLYGNRSLIESKQELIKSLKDSSNKKKEFLTKKLKIEYQLYKSYEIEIFNNKIKQIKFKKGNYRFLIDISYNIINSYETLYYETEPEERKVEHKFIKDLRINYIFKKVKNGYGEKKASPNYYKYLGIEKYSLLEFVKKIIENYHNI